MNTHFNSIQYWENRYVNGGNSGLGSYGNIATIKSKIINNYIEKLNIKTILDVGCGDGNQIGYFKGYEKYYGYDVSNYILKKCSTLYKNNDKMVFINDYNDISLVDMVMSIDVLYHIVENELYIKYIHDIFKKSSKYVLIFSTDYDEEEKIAHIQHRNFTKYIHENIIDFKLVESTGSNSMGTRAIFFLYEKINNKI